MLKLHDLLSARGFDVNPRMVKIVRHKDQRFDIEALQQDGTLEAYQQFQGETIFDGCSHVVSFIGEEGTKSRFVGVYEVGPRRPSSEASRDHRLAEWAVGAQHWYPMERISSYDDLRNRVVIDWGKGTRSWHQWYRDREVLEIRPEGRALPPFQNYLEVHLGHDQLKQLAENPAAHPDWVAALSAVGAIYLIVSATGEQYVGSATGDKGLWQRWQQYAATGHCGNAQLQSLCQRDSQYPRSFRFSILDTFSKYVARDVALRKESFFKKKLGTRATGLNDN